MKSSPVKDCGEQLKRGSRAARPLPEISLLRSLFQYDHLTGELYYVDGMPVRFQMVNPPLPYKKVYVRGGYYMYHRICYALHTGCDPYPLEIDHIDRDASNNRASNLRAVTYAENQANKKNRSRCKDEFGSYKPGYLFHKVGVGESFYVDDVTRLNSLKARASQLKKWHGWAYKVRCKREDGGRVTITRVA